MRHGHTFLIGVATAVAVTTFHAALPWAAPRSSYSVGGKQYDCRDSNPYKNSIKDLQAERNELDGHIKALSQLIIEADRKVRAAKAKYDQTFAMPSSNRPGRDSLWNDY